MIAEEALYQFIEKTVIEAGNDSVLGNAKTFKSLRGNVEEAYDVIRVEGRSGKFEVANYENETERDIDCTIQCFVLPKGDSLYEQDEAIEKSFQMAKRLSYLINTDSSGLGGKVCTAYFSEFDTDLASLGGVWRGSTYLYGKINGEV